MVPPVEWLAEFLPQVAFVSALLAGFAFSAATNLVRREDATRLTGLFVAVMAVSAAALLLSAFFSALLVADVKVPPPEEVRKPAIEYVLNFVSTCFFHGSMAFIGGLGLLGWLRSRALGIATSVIAGSGTVLLVVVFDKLAY